MKHHVCAVFCQLVGLFSMVKWKWKPSRQRSVPTLKHGMEIEWVTGCRWVHLIPWWEWSRSRFLPHFSIKLASSFSFLRFLFFIVSRQALNSPMTQVVTLYFSRGFLFCLEGVFLLGVDGSEVNGATEGLDERGGWRVSSGLEMWVGVWVGQH